MHTATFNIWSYQSAREMFLLLSQSTRYIETQGYVVRNLRVDKWLLYTRVCLGMAGDCTGIQFFSRRYSTDYFCGNEKFKYFLLISNWEILQIGLTIFYVVGFLCEHSRVDFQFEELSANTISLEDYLSCL